MIWHLKFLRFWTLALMSLWGQPCFIQYTLLELVPCNSVTLKRKKLFPSRTTTSSVFIHPESDGQRLRHVPFFPDIRTFSCRQMGCVKLRTTTVRSLSLVFDLACLTATVDYPQH